MPLRRLKRDPQPFSSPLPLQRLLKVGIATRLPALAGGAIGPQHVAVPASAFAKATADRSLYELRRARELRRALRTSLGASPSSGRPRRLTRAKAR